MQLRLNAKFSGRLIWLIYSESVACQSYSCCLALIISAALPAAAGLCSLAVSVMRKRRLPSLTAAVRYAIKCTCSLSAIYQLQSRPLGENTRQNCLLSDIRYENSIQEGARERERERERERKRGREGEFAI